MLKPETVILVLIETVVLATEVAEIVTVKSDAGADAGAVYVVDTPLAVALGETEPQGAAAHDTVQVTPFVLGSLETIAETCAVPPACSVVGFAVIVSVTLGGGVGVWLFPPPQASIAIKNPVKTIESRILTECFMFCLLPTGWKRQL